MNSPPNVPTEICFVNVRFSANVAFIIPFSCMNSHMNFQFLFIGKGFAATKREVLIWLIWIFSYLNIWCYYERKLTSHTDCRIFSNASTCCDISTATLFWMLLHTLRSWMKSLKYVSAEYAMNMPPKKDNIIGINSHIMTIIMTFHHPTFVLNFLGHKSQK